MSSGWPFGFIELNVDQPTPSSQFIVLPKTFEIKHLPLLQSNISSIDGYHQTSHAAMQNEFAGLREYRHGDGLKHIHWSATARHQELIVREYDSHDRQHYLVILDCSHGSDVGEAPESSFEYAVTIAASILKYAIEQRIGLHLIAQCSHPLEISISPGCQNVHDYVEQMAWLQADEKTPYTDIVHQSLEKFANVNTLITIGNKNNSASLAASSTGHIDICLQEESFLYPLGNYKEGWINTNENNKALYITSKSKLEALFSHAQ